MKLDGASQGSTPCIVVLVLVLGGAATAQETGDLARIFQDQIRVEVVSIDVVVLDKKGRSVDGLTAADFVLRVDGERVDITNFYAPAAGPAVGGVPQSTPLDSPGGALREIGDGVPQPGHVVVFFDNFHTAPMGRQRVLRDLPPFLEEQLAAGYRVMVVAFDRPGVRIVAPFTTDPAALRSALAKVSEMQASGFRRHLDRNEILRDILDIYDSCGGGRRPGSGSSCQCVPRMRQKAYSYSEIIEAQKRGALAAVDNLVSALGSLGGRKSFLYVSDGLEHQAGVDVFQYIDELCPGRLYQEKALSGDGLAVFNELVGHANANRVTFYSLQASGPQGFSSASAEYGVGSAMPSPAGDRVRIDNIEGSLTFMARETGGRAVLKATHFDEDLKRIDHEMEAYYSLGFSPSHEASGRSHQVKVTLPGDEKARLSYRRSFLHKEPDRLMAEKAMGAFLFGVERNPLGAAVHVGTPSAGTEETILVPIEVRVPLERLTLLPGAGERRGQLTFIVAAPDKAGRRTEVRKMRLEVKAPLAGDEAPEEYRFGVRLELPAGEHEIGIGLWDDVAETVSFLRVDVAAGL